MPARRNAAAVPLPGATIRAWQRSDDNFAAKRTAAPLVNTTISHARAARNTRRAVRESSAARRLDPGNENASPPNARTRRVIAAPMPAGRVIATRTPRRGFALSRFTP